MQVSYWLLRGKRRRRTRPQAAEALEKPRNRRRIPIAGNGTSMDKVEEALVLITFASGSYMKCTYAGVLWGLLLPETCASVRTPGG